MVKKLDNYSKYYRVSSALKERVWENFLCENLQDSVSKRAKRVFSRDTVGVLKSRLGDLRSWGLTLVQDLCVARAKWQASFTRTRMKNTVVSVSQITR